MAEDIQSLEITVHNLITRFIERQKITLEAFRALRPAIVEADHITCDEQQLIKILTAYMDSPWQGHWHEWSYYFQGVGCRLINSKTSEIIEWEAADVNTFDRYWFVNWIEWLWMFHPNDKDLKMLKDFYSYRPNRYDLYKIIFPMLKLLVLENYITHNPEQKNRYTLLDKKQQSTIA